MKVILSIAIAATIAAATAAQKPNIVFIMADDLGWKDVGYQGAAFFETPHINQLAAGGMTFQAAYSGGPNCAPTRACLMSGAYTPRHHIYQPGGVSKGNPRCMKLLVPTAGKRSKELRDTAARQFLITTSLEPEFVCIPEVLKTAGYATARIGKWHLGADTQGFDLSDADGKGSLVDNHYGDVDVAEQLTDRALRFIEDNRQRPFFLYLTHWDVHAPWRARMDVVAKYQARLDKLPVDARRNFNPVYAAMIEAVDISVGRVVAKLDELGLSENTLVVFTSDNGGIDAVSQLEPLRGEKGSLFEGGVRIPCVMRWPGRIAAGSSCATPITSVDYLPTFASLAGAALPAGQAYDGADVSPLLAGKPLAERAIFWHYPLYLSGKGLEVDVPGVGRYSWRGFPSTSMRRGDFKLIGFHETGAVALFNLQDDPGEQHDLARELPEVTAKLRAELEAWKLAVRAPVPGCPNPEYGTDGNER